MRYAGLLAALMLVGCHRSAPKPPPSSSEPGFVIQPSDTATIPEDSMSTATPDVTAKDTLPVAAAQRLSLSRDGGPVGLPAGLNAPPESRVGEYGTTGAYQGVDPRFLMATLRKSAYLHFARVVAIPRKRQTVDGGIDSRYSARRTWTAIDQIAALPLDELKSFVDMGVLRGLSIVDDATCAECYGGRAITLEQIDSVYSYAKKKLPAWLPLGIRIHPTWLAVRPSLSQNIDFMWVQYLERRGDQMTFLNRQAAYAKTLPHPVRVVYGLNFKHFHKNGSMITASELETYGMNSIKMPGNCIFGGFTWTADWRNNGRGAVWDTKLLPLAKQQNAPLTCAAP